MLSRRAPADPGRLRRMLASAPHRGGITATAHLGACAVGVSAQDGEASLAQADGRVAALVGTLDNGPELAAVLAAGDGGRPQEATEEATPAALLLRAFERWGADAPRHLRGILAGAVSDGSSVWLFRDHLGLAPLHVRDTPGTLLCATEAKQVIAGSDLSAEPDLDGVRQYFYGRIADGQTALRGVRRVPRATVLEAGLAGPTRTGRYWDPAPLVASADVSLPEARAQFVALLEQAVRRCVRAGAGISLSGGLDSPAVAAFAAPYHREVAGDRLRALSAVFPDQPAVDETPWIELVAGHLDLDLHTHVLEARPLDGIEQWAQLLDAPLTTVSLPEIAEEYRRARSRGVTTLLTGELAEYLYGQQKHLLGHLALTGQLGALAHHARHLRSVGRPWWRIAREVAATVAPPFLATRLARARRAQLMQVPPWISLDPLGALGYREDLARPARRRWTALQTVALQGDSDTFEVDELCAEVCGVRVRRPFADVDLWEFLLSLPAEVKFPDPRSKSFAREALRGYLPDALIDRRRNTTFDDHYHAVADYGGLAARILGSAHRLPWIDYRLLETRLEAGTMGSFELRWATDLAWAHAFLDRW